MKHMILLLGMALFFVFLTAGARPGEEGGCRALLGADSLCLGGFAYASGFVVSVVLILIGAAMMIRHLREHQGG